MAVLEDVAIGANLQRAAHDERIVVLAEHEDRGARVVQPQAADEGQAAERAGAHGKACSSPTSNRAVSASWTPKRWWRPTRPRLVAIRRAAKPMWPIGPL